MLPTFLDLASLNAFYREGGTPLDVVEAVIARRSALADKAVFITPTSDEGLRQAARDLMAAHPDPQSLPLWGVPFAVKDNIDVAGMPTTAACPAFAYEPAADAFVVARLKAAGAIVIGKTNLDQFATGLNGTRSPYGAPRSVFDADYISGGSSSGSAVAVAAGLCTFSLGTDTAGSGRVPAMFNNLVGIKPSIGLLSATGVVPACRSLDCVSIFAGSVADGTVIRRVAEGFDEVDAYSRKMQSRTLASAGLRVGVLTGAEREFYGNAEVERIYDHAITATEALGAKIVSIDYAPFRQAAELLYGGPWVAERLAAVADFFATHSTDMDPTVRGIIAGAEGKTAVEAFDGQYRLADLRRQAEKQWALCDVLLLPTAPTSYTVTEMQAEPVLRNSHLGRYTNFVNLFDCAAIAVPAGFDADGHLPGGVTLIGPAFSDDALAQWAARLHKALGVGQGIDKSAAIPEFSSALVPTEFLPLVVVGAHLTGMPLNKELTNAGGLLLKSGTTAADYRLFALPNTTPPKPGLVRVPGHAGSGIAVEVWALPPAEYGAFIARIPAPLGVGKIELKDGSVYSGFLCESYALSDAQDISHFGGWRDFINGGAGT
ncbi:allophanate hydrolase [Devosia riboflavina]|uniref:Allophanate hydrolase n=1 Tax=Devosia riboflavina TaxID=46914 RepID=A0A087M712_9HYPH|nr:allophanate hydrolase [Devosia riboflavina]KFL32665.1 allophanate hydrolase [Devosia riboflavina]